ncbi:MAG: Cobyrinic acid ac-diamide synthase, partial [Verrucomicrobiales bacterium]|nr:Cobyrinic acid ac-diamide synthase [Verrucomicrobiales bacterium]
GGGEKEAARLKVPLLAQLPIDIPTRSGGDEGRPVALGESEIAGIFSELAVKVRALTD